MDEKDVNIFEPGCITTIYLTLRRAPTIVVGRTLVLHIIMKLHYCAFLLKQKSL